MSTMIQGADAINDLVAISRRYGADPDFVLAGGGNTSFKQGERLWVKASGHALATIGPDGFVELDRTALKAMLSADWPHDAKQREALFIERVMASRIHPELKQRPSVEALLHHLLPDQLVVHTHPGIVNALTCCVNGEKLARELFGDEVLWQAYVDPGVILAQTLQRSLEAHSQRTGRAPSAIFLANHGLIVSGATAKEIAAISERIVGRIKQHLASLPYSNWTDRVSAPRHALLSLYAEGLAALVPGLHAVTDTSDAIARLVCSQRGCEVALAGPLTPDQIVYCRSVPLFVDTPSNDLALAGQQWSDARNEYLKQHGFEPWVALVAGVGMIAFRESPKLAEVTRSIFADAANVYHEADRLGGVHVLERRDRQFIEQWEVEAYRRSIMSKSTSAAGG